VKGYLARTKKLSKSRSISNSESKVKLNFWRVSHIQAEAKADESLLIPASPYVFVGMRNSKIVDLFKDPEMRNSKQLMKVVRARAVDTRTPLSEKR